MWTVFAPRLLLKKAYDLERRSNLQYRVLLSGRDQPGKDIPAHLC
ncbi:putative RNA-directed DNA polymerase from transposon BS, partial [Fusarium oxysporum f. sp. albedinis]